MKERLYVNPWRHNKDGSPKMQKSEPRLKSAFADKRKKRVHSRDEFGSETVLRRNAWCVLAVGSGRGNRGRTQCMEGDSAYRSARRRCRRRCACLQTRRSTAR